MPIDREKCCTLYTKCEFINRKPLHYGEKWIIIETIISKRDTKRNSTNSGDLMTIRYLIYRKRAGRIINEKNRFCIISE